MKETMNQTVNNQETVKVNSQVSKDLVEKTINSQVSEKVDRQDDKTDTKALSIDELKASLTTYRANIKKGETKNERGQYDEALVLENEAKLKEVENEIKRIEEEERKAQKISELQKEIAGYRDFISEAEKKNNENDVLENENKLRAVEQQILSIKKYGPEPKVESYTENSIDDDLFNRAKEIILQEKKASASLLQEQLGIDYLQAGKLIDKMEEDGIIGPYNGDKPREILINTEKVDNNKNWMSDHFKNFEDDAEETPKPAEATKKESKPLWKKMADFWTSDKGKNLWNWKKNK